MTSKAITNRSSLAGPGDDTITITVDDLNGPLILDGGEGTDTLQLEGGGTFDLSTPYIFSSIEIIKGSAADDTIVIYDDYWYTDLLNEIHTIEGGGGNDILSLVGWDLDLRDKTITGFAEIQLTDWAGTEVTLNDKNLAFQLTGYWSNDDRLVLEGGTFDANERKALFDQGIDSITDASGLTYNADAPVLTNLDEQIVLKAGQINQPIRLDVNADATVTDGDDAVMGSLYLFHGVLAASETISFAQTGQVFLSDGMNEGSKIFVGPDGGRIEIGSIVSHNGYDFEIVFNGNATHARVQELLHALEYSNTSNDPSLTLQRDIDIYLNDKGGRYSQSLVSITIAPDGVKVLTSGVDQPVSTAGNDIFAANHTTLNDGDILDGGDGIDTLRALNVSGSGTLLDLTIPAVFTNIEKIRMSDFHGDVLRVNAERLNGITTIDGGAGLQDYINLVGTSFDLTGKTIIGIERINFVDKNASVTIDNKSIAALIQGDYYGNSALTLVGGVFTEAERKVLFENNIKTVTDASGTYTNKAPQLGGLDGDKILTSAGKTVFIDAGRNMTVSDDYGAFSVLEISVWDGVTSGQDLGDRLGIDTSGSVSLSDGLNYYSKIFVNKVEIGSIYNSSATSFHIALDVNATAAQVQELMRALTYTNEKPAGTPLGHREIIISLWDSAGQATTSKISVDENSAISVDENFAPTQLDLSAKSVNELAVAGASVGSFLVTDANAGDSFTYTLLDNAGGRFALRGGELVVADGARLDFEQAASHAVKVRVTDAGGLSFEKILTINVQNVEPETTSGTSGDDRFIGGVKNDTLSGGAGNDVLLGRGSHDRLSGGLGKDTMTGGTGKDVFVFNSAVAKKKNANIDTVTDFKAKDDAFWLDHNVFRGLGKKGSLKKPVKLSKDAFFKGEAAHDKDDRIIVSKSGKIYYDADGNGSQAKIHIATVSKAAVKSMTNADFFVI